jgi:hypothetical protein
MMLKRKGRISSTACHDDIQHGVQSIARKRIRGFILPKRHHMFLFRSPTMGCIRHNQISHIVLLCIVACVELGSIKTLVTSEMSFVLILHARTNLLGTLVFTPSVMTQASSIANRGGPSTYSLA